MSTETSVPATASSEPRYRIGNKVGHGSVLIAAAFSLVIFLVFYNLTEFPATWFDEGSHLHVPKALVLFGKYADYSSDGFRSYGPTVGVGPTVMLPIALSFRVFGIGLLQARFVMALYLLVAIAAFYQLARTFGGPRFSAVATILVLSSRGVALLELGRQVLGEVPALFFLLAGLVLWFRGWQSTSVFRLIIVGLLLGLAAITKYQFLLVLAPVLFLSLLLNLVYYRIVPHRQFVIPGATLAASFAVWQIFLVLYLGPATTSENFAALRDSAAGAALVFNPTIMGMALKELLGIKVYLSWLLPSLVYGGFISLPRTQDGQRRGIVWLLVVINLGWYVTASIGWLRYAFLGLALSSLFISHLIGSLTTGFRFQLSPSRSSGLPGSSSYYRVVGEATLMMVLAVMIIVPLAQNTRQIVSPQPNTAALMADYLRANVPENILIETWEPEMGFLTDHNYHFPPASLLPRAVSYKWLSGDSPAEHYDYVQENLPKYLLLGEFARWVDLYPPEILSGYVLVTEIGAYQLYQLRN